MQNEPNFQNAEMIVTSVMAMTTNNEPRTMNYLKQTQTNPILSRLSAIALATAEAKSRDLSKTTVRLKRIQKAGKVVTIADLHWSRFYSTIISGCVGVQACEEFREVHPKQSYHNDRHTCNSPDAVDTRAGFAGHTAEMKVSDIN
jgi:hypothetical protein